MEDSYRTILAPAQAEFTEKKSVFIGRIAPVSSEQEALAFLEEVRAAHRDATHNVWAFLLRAPFLTRCSDDGEPSGTAGRPALEVLQREALTDCAVVVTRYFGGILLGAGGLTRAYARGAKIALDAASVAVMRPAVRVSAAMPYELYGRVRYLLPDYDAAEIDANFGESVLLSLTLEESRFPAFSHALTELSAGKVAPEITARLYRAF